MATHGAVGEFAHSKEWTDYCEHLQQYFLANNVKDAGKQRAILLSVCGASTYRLIRSLVAPGKPTDKTFEEIVTLLKNHYTPPPSEIVQRYNFNKRVQKKDETIAEFMAKLRRMSEH